MAPLRKNRKPADRVIAHAFDQRVEGLLAVRPPEADAVPVFAFERYSPWNDKRRGDECPGSQNRVNPVSSAWKKYCASPVGGEPFHRLDYCESRVFEPLRVAPHIHDIHYDIFFFLFLGDAK